MTNFWKRTLYRMIPRHGAGLFGIGSAVSASLYLSVLIAEIVSTFVISNTSVSMTDTIIAFVKQPTLNSCLTIGVFALVWIFLGAIALAGGCRYLIGCVDPKHIAQRTFFNGIRFYWKIMLGYTLFLVIGGISFLVLLWFLMNPIIGSSVLYLVITIVLYVVLATFFWSKLSYVPYFMLSGMGIFSSIARSWKITRKRIWSISLLRISLVALITLPVVMKSMLSPTTQIPSLSIWPFIVLIVFGYVELIVVRGYQEWQEEKNLPMVSKKYLKEDIQVLDVYDHDANGPRSMEF